MRGFEMVGVDAAGFVRLATDALRERGLADMVSVRQDGRELVVSLSRMGTSEVRFTLDPTDGGFRATPSAERISPFHAPFVGAFESGFADVLARLGARVV